MFRRGIGECSYDRSGALRVSRPIRHFTALCWMMGLGIARGLLANGGIDPAPSVSVAGP